MNINDTINKKITYFYVVRESGRFWVLEVYLMKPAGKFDEKITAGILCTNPFLVDNLASFVVVPV